MLSITLNATDATELRKQCAELAGDTLSMLSDDALLEALRGRMRPRGLVVQVEPFVTPGTAADAQPKAQTTTRKKPAVDKAPPPPAPEPAATEPEKTVAAEPAKADAAVIEDTFDDPPEVTKADVISALNAYAAAKGGQPAARLKMAEVAPGVTRLADFPPDKFGALVQALAA